MQFKDMTTRQKATIGIFALVVVVIIWQVIGLFKSSSPEITPVPQSQMSPSAAMPQAAPASVVVQKKPPVITEREAALIRLQQQTEEKYLNALNELQMLKVERDIAETNKAIASAKLDTVTAQKSTVDILTKPSVSEGNYAQGLATPGSPPNQPSGSAPMVSTEANYLVISVTQLQQRWSAVLGLQGKLYTVYVGDVLPPDGSKVISIDKSGVTLEKGDVKKKISLVPVI